MAVRVLHLQWQRHDSFFALWRMHRAAIQLLYVIGTAHHCYVGSIGSRGGLQGLAMRYQWQYLNRAKAIFGLEEGSGQNAFSAVLQDVGITAEDILAAEAFVQHSLIERVGVEQVLFEPEDIVEGVTFVSTGDVPPFLSAL